MEAAIEQDPDLILADVSMPVLGGIDAARRIRQAQVHAKIIFLTMHAEVAYAVEALAAGGSGYLLKSSVGEELLTGIRVVMGGDVYIAASIRDAVINAQQSLPKKARSGADSLTPRQREVLRLLAQGLQAKEVATRLNVSTKTIEFHKQQMKQVLGIQTVAELAVYAARHGLIE